jgi:transmembrane sensor
VASNRHAIEERAATWLQKRDGEEWGDDDQAYLTQWLDADTHHRVAFLRLEAAWAEMSRLQAIGAGYPRGRVPSADELDAAASVLPRGRAQELHEGRRHRTWSSLRVALAACLVALIIGGVFFSTHFSRVENYSTPVGGLASVPLKDGSKITLSSATVLRVRLGDSERRIDLAQGEAFFDVAKDPGRAFIVDAGAGRVIAVGTQFSVRRDGNDLRVVVTEGTVRLEDATTARLLHAGSVARGNGQGVVVQAALLPDAEALLSWRSGYVVFHETALADAVAEFNRYNARQVIIDDPRVAAIRLTGKFRSTNIDSFSRLLQQSFPIRVRQTPEGTVLSAPESGAP